MKRLISNVTLQISVNGFTVFTEYNRNSSDYSFTPYKSLEEATEAAVEMVNIWNVHFMSIVNGYDVIQFDANSNKSETFVKVK